MSRARARRISTALLLVLGAWILVATWSPRGTPPASALGLNDLVAHFAAFALLGAAGAARFAVSAAARRSPRRMLLVALLGFWIFAAVTEIGQGPVEGRDPALADWLADMGGALTGFFLGGAAMRAVVERTGRGRE